jgi:hypothetical protein
MTSHHISAKMTYVIWHEEHFWNICVFQRAHIFSLVKEGIIIYDTESVCSLM